MPESRSIHSVPHVAAGYLYQVRMALVCTLQYVHSNPTIEVAIEKFDDVSFEKEGVPIELLQTKHHLSKSGNLTDSSVDLWKTIRVWSESVKDDPSLPGRTRFVLVTTACAPDNSAASHLRPIHMGTRDSAEAVIKLQNAGNQSRNRELADAVTAFMSLTPSMRKAMCDAVYVFDSAPCISDVDSLIKNQVRMIASREKMALACERLEGWWFSRICEILRNNVPSTISIIEVEQKLDEIREDFRRDSLPFTMEDKVPPPETLETFDEMCFVRQLQLIDINSRRLFFAKRDFYRASEQRSYWARKLLILNSEVEKFDRTLIEEWQPRFEQMCTRLSESCCEEDLCNAGQELYSWIENDARFPIRNDSSRFFNVGSFHILADDLHVGWHRDYRTLCGDHYNGDSNVG